MSTFIINKNNIEEIFGMCCLFISHNEKKLERLKQQSNSLSNISLRFWRVRLDCWSGKTRNIATTIENELCQWMKDSDSLYNHLIDAFRLAENVVSLYCKGYEEFEEMHVNSVDMEIIVSYAYKHGNE